MFCAFSVQSDDSENFLRAKISPNYTISFFGVKSGCVVFTQWVLFVFCGPVCVECEDCCLGMHWSPHHLASPPSKTDVITRAMGTLSLSLSLSTGVSIQVRGDQRVVPLPWWQEEAGSQGSHQEQIRMVRPPTTTSLVRRSTSLFVCFHWQVLPRSLKLIRQSSCELIDYCRNV